MKGIVKNLLAPVLCFTYLCVNAVSINDLDIKFKYKRLPNNPIDKSYTTYNRVVLLPYVEEYAKKVDADFMCINRPSHIFKSTNKNHNKIMNKQLMIN